MSEKISLNIFGEGTQKNEIKRFIDSNNIPNVNIYDRVSDKEIKNVFNLSDALVVHLKKDNLFTMTIPSKTQAYLLSGKPILMAVQGEAASIIENARAGAVCEPENIESIVGGILTLYSQSEDKIEQLGKNGRIFYDQTMQMSKGVDEFTKLFRELIKQ